MDDKPIKFFLAFLLAVFAIMAVSMLYAQHEKYELLRDAMKYGYAVEHSDECMSKKDSK